MPKPPTATKRPTERELLTACMDGIDLVMTSAKLVAPHRRKPFAVKLMMAAGKKLGYNDAALTVGRVVLDAWLPDHVPTDRKRPTRKPRRTQ